MQRRLFLIIVIIISLILSACVQQQPTGTTQEAPASQQPTAEATEESAASSDAAVQGAEAASATEKKAVSVVSDEDVTTPRSHLGGIYKDVDTSDAVSFHPYMTTDTTSSSYQANVYSYELLRLDEKTLEYIPNMAERYEISEDGLIFTFHLRQNMQWSDGTPLTAQDFKWTYDQVIKPENEFPYVSQLDFIASYEALDDFTLQIKIKEVYAPALGQMVGLITPLPKHVWEKLDWKDPAKNPEINSPSVVSGPFKLKEWKRDQFAIFVANESYWYKGRPNFDEYQVEIVPDEDITYEKMKNGETDTGAIRPEQLEDAKKLENINVYEWWPAAAVWQYIGLNLREGFPTHDLRVRRGLAYALDKDTMTQEIMVGTAKRMCSSFPESSWVYNPDVECYNYDVEKAKAEFEQAGYTFDGEKILDKDGNPLKLKLIFGPNTSKTRELIAVSVQDYLSQLGIETEVKGMEWGAYLEALSASEPDWDIFVGAWQATIEPHIMYTIWSESSIPDLNAGAYINKEVEKLFEEGGATYDQAVRKEKYQRVQKILADDAPYIFLWYQQRWSGQNKRIQGIEPTALGIGWNLPDWYIQSPQ
jgi:peptide/nickel transport system substrate-binding protein